MIEDITPPLADATDQTISEALVEILVQDNFPQTPVTPQSSEAVTSLRKLIEQIAHLPDQTSRQRLYRRLQKLTNATQLSFAERALLREQNNFLNRVNSEAKTRRSTKTKVTGTARVMSFEDLERARIARAVKETEKAAKKARSQPRKMARSTVSITQGIPGEESRDLPQGGSTPGLDIVEATQTIHRGEKRIIRRETDGDAKACGA